MDNLRGARTRLLMCYGQPSRETRVEWIMHVELLIVYHILWFKTNIEPPGSYLMNFQCSSVQRNRIDVREFHEVSGR